MSFLNEIIFKKRSLNHIHTMVRHVDGSLTKEDVYLGNSEILSVGLSYVIDEKPNLNVTEVMKGLFMGSQDVPQSESLLKSFSINCVLSLGIEVPKYEGIKYLFIQVFDLPEYNILEIFRHSFLLIDTELQNNNVVYVHCNAGISRSASLVIAYVMKKRKINFKLAYEELKSKRPSIKPNEGFLRQLFEYEKYLIETNYL